MSDSPSTADSDTPALPASSSSPSRSRRSRGGGLIALALLISLVALGASGWQLWRQQQLAAADNAMVAALRAELQALDSAQQQFVRRTEAEQSQWRTDKARFEQMLEAQGTAVQALAAQWAEVAQTDRRLWQLSEAEYLLQLGQQRLRTGGNAQAALQWLREADQLVRDQHDPDLYSVRRALAREIAALEAVPEIDIDGLYLRLAALAEQALSLPLTPAPVWQATASKAAPPSDWRERVQHGFAAAWEKLSSYIRIQRRDVPPEPLLEPALEHLVRLNLELLVEQAQLALLAGNSDLYGYSLNRAAAWLEKYYRAKPEVTAALVEALEQLAATPIVAPLPEIGAARRILADYLEHRQAAEARPVSAEDEQP